MGVVDIDKIDLLALKDNFLFIAGMAANSKSLRIRPCNRYCFWVSDVSEYSSTLCVRETGFIKQENAGAMSAEQAAMVSNCFRPYGSEIV